jgi:hypothetical protein
MITVKGKSIGKHIGERAESIQLWEYPHEAISKPLFCLNDG